MNNRAFEDGSAAYERDDYETAYRLWKPLAEQGVTIAQYNLGCMHHEGRGVPQDYAEAMRWYRKAAEQELAIAVLRSETSDDNIYREFVARLRAYQGGHPWLEP